MKNVVFLGPTLPAADAARLLPARFLPPAAMGDVYNAIERERPDVIVIIDGYFDTVPSVWHKEILYGLSCGIRIIGASSIGALRAAELHDFGMDGSGWVFEAFRSGVLEDDDEVAVVHSEDFRPLSAAMVNLRVGLQRAVDRGLLNRADCEVMLGLSKQRFYPHRSWKQLFLDAAEHGIGPDAINALRDFVEREHPDIKREDASNLLAALAQGHTQPPRSSSVEFRSTIFWDKLATNERRLGPAGSNGVRGEALRRFVKATDGDLAALLRTGLLLHLVEKECAAIGLDIDQQQFDIAVRDFRLRHGIITRESMQSWLEREGLDADQFGALMQLEARILFMLKMCRSEIDERLFVSLALLGRLGELVSKFSVGETRTNDSLANRASAGSDQEIEAFYRKYVREFGGTLQRHARDLGFSSGSELLDEVRKIYPRHGDHQE